MSVAEETLKNKTGDKTTPKWAQIINRSIDFFSSVRFGVVLLCILVFLSFLGMIIIQQNVEGFDAHYASYTPAEKMVFGTLGLFDVYNSWYYNFILVILSLNIVLASIDHLPGAFSFIVKPKLDASRKWLLGQKQNALLEKDSGDEKELAEKIASVFRKNGLKPTITQKKGKFYVFGQSGKWNRMGAYIVHVFLLVLFMGYFVANTTSFDADVRFAPGETTNQIEMIRFKLDQKEKFAVGLPFTITCTDIQQKLIDPQGSIDVNNTLDWSTSITINDPDYGKTDAVVSLNRPFEYRGYRFFQASAITLGSARTMTLDLTPQGGGQMFQVELPRNGSIKLPDGTEIKYEDFLPDFVLSQGQAATRSPDYNNPAVKLKVTPPGGSPTTAYAFAAKLPDSAPVGAPVAGYKWHLAKFEKSPQAHVLSIKYDPFNASFIAWYIGGLGLIGALIFVFFVSHRRVWALIDKNESGLSEIVLGGNTNRNHQGFEDKFQTVVGEIETGV
ncbi:MAG: cytochrome c biogenesis protein ResB [Pyrinomonadaceae bacterium]